MYLKTGDRNFFICIHFLLFLVVWSFFSFLHLTSLHSNGDSAGKYSTRERIERVRILGFPRLPKSVVSSVGNHLDFDYNMKTLVLDVKKPVDNVASDFSFVIRV